MSRIIIKANTKAFLKTFVLFVLTTLLVCSFCGAGYGETVDAHQLFGTVTGDVYENEFLGIGCKLNGWYYYSEEDIAAVNQLTRDVFSSKDISDILDNEDVLYLMMAGALTGSENVNIVLQYENEIYLKMVETVGIEGLLKLYVRDYFSSVLEQAGYQNIDIDVIQISIGGIDFFGIKTSYDYLGAKYYLKQAYSLYGNYMMTLTVSGPDYESIDDILSKFYIIQDNRTEKTALLDQHQDQDGAINDTAEVDYYHDQKTGTHFMIPVGWEEKELSQEREIIKMKMSPINDDVVSIMFGWQDFWDALSVSQRNGLGLKSRKDLDSLLDAEILSLMFDVDEKDVEMRTVSGTVFGFGTVSQTTAGLTMDMRVAITIHNGYLIVFQMADLYNNYGDIFDSVLESVYFN